MMIANAENNENWGQCPKCGEPMLIDPNTGKTEPCAMCASLASKRVGVMGIGLLIAGIAAIVALVYFCVRILL